MKNVKIIEKDKLYSNIAQFQSKKICAMVKSNAYGHGLSEIVKLLENQVEMFGVVNIDEAIAVRKISNKPILICSKFYDVKTCKKHNFQVFVDDETSLRACLKAGLQDNLHLKINCGMNRFGVKNEINVRLINKILEENQVTLRSICTHFPNTANKNQTEKCYQKFMELRSGISQNVQICFGGSEILNYPFEFDILRLGICMYGYGRAGLLPIMRIESFVEKIFYASAGEHIGYGTKFEVKRDGFYAIVPVGYGDGLRRNLSGKFYVSINGIKYKSVGNICMDAFFVKVDKNVKVGDKVVVMENAEQFAKKINTISYEILTGFSNFRGKTEII